MQEASLIISRSGYSTIMDLVQLQKRAILVPTPGQTEQEYLASYLMEKKFFIAIEQKAFSLTAAIDAVKDFEFAEMNLFNEVNLSSVVHELLDQIQVKSLHGNESRQ